MGDTSSAGSMRRIKRMATGVYSTEEEEEEEEEESASERMEVSSESVAMKLSHVPNCVIKLDSMYREKDLLPRSKARYERGAMGGRDEAKGDSAARRPSERHGRQ